LEPAAAGTQTLTVRNSEGVRRHGLAHADPRHVWLADASLVAITYEHNRAGDLVLLDCVSGSTRVLDRAAGDATPFIDTRGGTTTFGTAAWLWERRWVAAVGGPIPAGPPAPHPPWLDWIPVGDAGIVHITAADDGRLTATHRRAGASDATRSLGTGRLMGLHRYGDTVLVVESDTAGTTLWLLAPDLTLRAVRHAPGCLVAAGGGRNGLLLDRDEPAAVPARIRLDLTGFAIRERPASGPLRTERVRVRAADAVDVPVDVVFPPDDLRGLVVVSYGCYGQTVELGLNPFRRALLDRGIGYALARIRGGGDLGHRWWLAGRGHRKPVAVSDLRCALARLAGFGVPLIGRSFSAGATIQLLAADRDPGRFAGLLVHQPLVRLTADDGGPVDDEFGADPHAAGLNLDVLHASGAAGPLPPLLVTVGTRDERTPWLDTWTWCQRALAAGALERVQIVVHDGDHDGPRDGSLERAALNFVGELCVR
jgi:hypothetical protein